ncbi:MAG: site-specific integrase, partial [Pseudomonadota bacterium]
LSSEEAERLIDSASVSLKHMILVALNTGMRKSEILGLTWRDIDFSISTISIRDSKNGDGRKIPMNETVLATLSDLGRKENDEKVFLRPGGQPVKSIRTAFENAVKRAGIDDFRFHDLRHTFASWLVMSGVDIKTVQELLGHKTFSMTLRYSHLSAQHKAEAVRCLDGKSGKILDRSDEEDRRRIS